VDIKKQVENFQPIRKLMLEGEAYYKGNNTAILERRKEFYNIGRGTNETDYTKANNQLPAGFTKMIVDQKVSYSVNSELTITSEGLDKLINLNKFRRSLKKVSKEASNKLRGIMQWYVSGGELLFKVIPSEQIILVPSADNFEVYDYVIRHYEVDKVEYAEVYDKDTRKLLIKENGEYVVKEEEQSNFILKGINTQDITTSWGRPPFSVLYNNDEHQNDLARFKRHLDAHDVVESDLCNNLEDFNEAYWVLKGYAGQDAEEFIKEFKRSRVMKVGEGGDASQETQETPYQAREATLKILKRNIFKFAQAVDPEDITGDVTNVAIESMYTQLDLKANDFEMEIQDFVAQCEYFINKYAELTGKQQVKQIELNFDRTMVMNKDRMIELANESIGSVSNQTRWEYDPRVQDTEEEKIRIENENKGNVDLE